MITFPEDALSGAQYIDIFEIVKYVVLVHMRNCIIFPMFLRKPR